MPIFEEIWNKVARDDGSGTRIIAYASKDDLLFIYASGFVDAEKFTFDQWADAFESSLQEDESYKVTYDQWMEKEKFYYDGPILIPFDPHKIPEREFTEDELLDMFKKCVLPSSQTTLEKIPLFLRDYKQRGLLKDGKMMMTAEIKNEIANFIIYYPSPLRILEVNIQRMMSGKTAIGAKADDLTKTGFALGTSSVKTTQAQLDTILGGSDKARKGPSKSDENLSVKDLQKQIKKRTV